jgi:cation:H+ antiporter
MSVAGDVIVSLIGLALIVVAAERLVEAAVGVSVALRVAPFVVAAVFIGFDPENLFVGSSAAAQGSSGIAIGSILGAAMVAIALAFGLTGALTPVRIKPAPVVVLAMPAGAVVLLGALMVDERLSRVDGFVLVAGYAIAVVVLVALGRRGTAIEPSGEAAEVLEHPPGRGRAVVMLAVSVVFLVVGSELLVDAARDLIDAAGWSETAAGMSVIALAVSAEELARELPAARRGHAELAVGNVAGSLIAFCLLNAGVIALVGPVEIDTQVVEVQLPIVLLTVAAVTWLLRRGGVGRIGGVGLVALYVAFVVSVV